MQKNIRRVTHVQNIRYDKDAERLYIIDQTLLPNEEREIELRTLEEMVEAIKKLRIRGAPAIGICAGYCMYVLARGRRCWRRCTAKQWRFMRMISPSVLPFPNTA